MLAFKEARSLLYCSPMCEFILKVLHKRADSPDIGSTGTLIHYAHGNLRSTVLRGHSSKCWNLNSSKNGTFQEYPNGASLLAVCLDLLNTVLKCNIWRFTMSFKIIVCFEVMINLQETAKIRQRHPIHVPFM